MGAQGSANAEGGEAAAAAAQGAGPAGAPAAADPSPPAEPAKPAEEKAPKPAKAPEPEQPKGAAEAEAKGGEEKSKKPKKEGKGKGKEGKEPKGKEGKAGKAAGKEGKEGKSKEAKGKEAKGKDAAKGKGKEKGTNGPVNGRQWHGGGGYRLNVKNLGKITEEKLKEMFEPFGTVSMAEIKKNDNGVSRGFGFVVLPGEKEGTAAAKEMNGKEVEGTTLIVAAAERRATETDDKGKGKAKGKSPQELYAAQSQYAQQWAAYSQMMYYQQYQQYAAMQQQNSFWAKSSSAASPKEYEGSLKSISSRNGYGFIVCKEIYDMFPVYKDGQLAGGRDVYVDEGLLPAGAERGSRLLFTMTANSKGHPQAVTCRLAPAI